MFRWLCRHSDDLLMVAGVALVSVGAYKIYAPAGYIAAGILLIGFAAFLAWTER